MPALTPSRTKYRKSMKSRVRGNASRGNTIAFGDYAIQTLERGYFKGNQIEAARRVAVERSRDLSKTWFGAI